MDGKKEMRMWMVPVEILCRQHLLGEHAEIHKHRHNFVKRHRMGKRVELGQIEPMSMQSRHDELAEEMKRRGFNHESPYTMPDISYLSEEHQNGKVDVEKSLADLIGRCNICYERSRNFN